MALDQPKLIEKPYERILTAIRTQPHLNRDGKPFDHVGKESE